MVLPSRSAVWRVINRAAHGFTLLELLFVIGILGVLGAVLLPAIQIAREAGRRMECTSALRQIGLAVQNFHDSFQFLPPAGIDGPVASPVHRRLSIPPAIEHSWGVMLLPYLEQSALHNRYRFDRDWRSVENQFVRESHVKLFGCPSTPDTKRLDMATTGGFAWQAAAGDYAVCTAVDVSLGSSTNNLIDPETRNRPQGIMQVNDVRRFADILDGHSYTVLYCEVAARPIRYRGKKRLAGGRFSGGAWTDRENAFIVHGYDRDGTTSPGPCAINCTNSNEIFAFHPGGAQVSLADGSVRFLSETTELRIVARLVTCQAGEIVGGF